MTHRVLIIPGDGIGPEVVAGAEAVLCAAHAPLDISHAQAGRDVQRRQGSPIGPDTLSALEDVDAVLFGATTTVPGQASGVIALRRALGVFATVRPAVSLPGIGRPGTDITVVRELTEDLYVQEEHDAPGGAQAISRITERATRRAARLAWHLAKRHGTEHVSIAHKATVLPLTHGLFLRVAMEEASAAGVDARGRLADSLAHDLVRDASDSHLVLAPNVFGDILSDVACALAGGLGLAPSGSYGDGPPMFEPVHGSAPDIAGLGVANPTAAVLSAAMMLDALELNVEAERIRAATRRAVSQPMRRTPDLGGRASTQDFTRTIIDHLEAMEVRMP